MIEPLKECPHCAGTLNDAGRCTYCGSKVYDFMAAAPEPQNRIAYLCDGQSKCKKTGCGLSQSGEFHDCYRTFDIDHAKNFRKVAAHWYEEVSESSDRVSVNDRKSEEMKLNNTKQ